MPKLLSAENRSAFCARLSAYIKDTELTRAVVVFHGGEPLLAGFASIVSFTNDLRAAVSAGVTLDIGLQTNGLLLTDAALDAFEAANIAVSLSLDGPQEANDLHRNTRKGRSSFARVLAGLERLKTRPTIFAGIIAVIDPAVAPETLFAFFAAHQTPKLDFLLPDAHHLRPPPGRDVQPNLYKDWLIQAFDLWLDKYPHLPIRTFEALLDSLAGLPSGTDAFGLGDVSLITVETDGSYHDLDVFKVVAEGATRLIGSVQDTAIHAVAGSDAIAAHRRLLRKDGLCSTCQACAVVDVCGGGSLPHRYGPSGFEQPTVYCVEMLALITHARERVAQSIQSSMPSARRPSSIALDLERFERAEDATSTLQRLWDDASATQRHEFVCAVEIVAAKEAALVPLANDIRALAPTALARLADRPGSVAWQRTVASQAAGRLVHTVDGQVLSAEGSYLRFAMHRLDDSSAFEIGLDDLWLRRPFGTAIEFEAAEVSSRATPLVAEALKIIDEWRPALAAEIRQVCRSVQFVRDPAAHPEKIVSFSDNTVPGALFVSVVQGERLIDVYDLADSLIHEHRHQKLYLLERQMALVEADSVKVVSPWREDLRPPSGLVHAVFVFAELQRFWEHVNDHGPTRLRQRAAHQLADTHANLQMAFATLAHCPLTTAGRDLIAVLKRVSDRALVVG